ncbi:hypothetical protein NKH77_50300 [Streptomyces sp. M19]
MRHAGGRRRGSHPCAGGRRCPRAGRADRVPGPRHRGIRERPCRQGRRTDPGAEPGDRTDEERAGAAVTALIHAGQAAGDIHPDVTVDDVYLLFSTAPTDQPPAARARWLALVTTGLTTAREATAAR